MSNTHLINELTPSITKHVNAFLEQQSPQEAAHQATIDDVKARIEKESIPAVKNALKSAIKELEGNRPDASSERRKEAALALLHIAHTLKLPLQLKGESSSSKPAAKGDNKRMTKVEMEALAGKIHAVLAKKKVAKIADIAQEVGADAKAVKSALLKLDREGKAESAGKKGRNGGEWKLK